MAQVNFRMKDERLSLIDRAAAIRGVTRTEFVLRSSEAAAIETLVERPIIALDDEAYDAFVAALDAPVASNDRLEETVGAAAAVGAMTAPEPIDERHDVSRFESGAESLDAWLRRKARLNEADIATTIVRSDCYRLERQSPGGIRTRRGMAPFTANRTRTGCCPRSAAAPASGA